MQMLTPTDIRRIRQELGLTGQQFADILKVHIDTVWKWEKGDRHPTYRKMMEINNLAKQADKLPA